MTAEREYLKMKERCKMRFVPVVEEIRRLITLMDGDMQTGSEYTEQLKNPLFVGIDGMCATGKTTLGYYLKEQFDCNLFHMDDFFLRPEQRTPERLAQVGGNVDYERFREEVLEPIRKKETVRYRPYCCRTGEIADGSRIAYKPLNIIEGSYSLHPFFGDLYDLRVFTESTPDRQKRHILERNGEAMLQRFVEEWIPKENAYFEKFRIREKCLIVPWPEDTGNPEKYKK